MRMRQRQPFATDRASKQVAKGQVNSTKCGQVGRGCAVSVAAGFGQRHAPQKHGDVVGVMRVWRERAGLE